MDQFEKTPSHARAQSAGSQPSSSAAGQGHRPLLTRGQRLLAGATAVAILMSGLNAFVQVGKTAVELCFVARHEK